MNTEFMHITNVQYQDFSLGWYIITYPTVKEGLYAINITGDVLSLVKNREKYIQPDFGKQSYSRYSLRGKEHDSTIKVMTSRLVAWEFVGHPENYMDLQVNHADGNHFNNYYKNLEWCTNDENNMHRKIYGLAAQGERHGWNQHPEYVVKDVINMIKLSISAPNIAKIIIKRYPNIYSLETKKDYDRIRGLVSKIKCGNSWYNMKNSLEGSTTTENIVYEKHIGEEVSRVGIHPKRIDFRKGGHIKVW